MNIQILDSWLKEYLTTKATAKKIAQCLSLCGPSVERLEHLGNDWLYDIEITTNRVDAMSVYGLAREAAAILPQFDIKAQLKPVKVDKINQRKPLGIKIKNNDRLCHRILAVKLEGAKLGKSPELIQKRLKATGQRPLINAIDVTNYVMWEIGHPIHVFDYDKIATKKIIVREAKKGETLVTLDNKKHILNGGEVVFDNGQGEIIDLPGIMGTKNTVVDHQTKNLLLWIESVDSVKIRQASMGLAIRSQAAVLNEKNVDLELGSTAILKAATLMKKTTGAKIASRLFDLHPKPYRAKSVRVDHQFIENYLGTPIAKSKITTILRSLEFEPTWQGSVLTVKVPSFRAIDVTIPEDIVEEVARIYGYHNLPSQLMGGKIPDPLLNSPFGLEMKIKNLLSGWGGTEVYTLSLVPNQWVDKTALKLKNPLGSETSALRTNLRSSLVDAANQNKGQKEPFHLFEMANVYLPRPGQLPDERMTLAGILSDYSYRKAKGIIEALLEKLGIKATFKQEEAAHFAVSRRVTIKTGKTTLGQFGQLEAGYLYYEFDMKTLQKQAKKTGSYQPIPKYPAQIEDITLKLPAKTMIGEVINEIRKEKLVTKTELTSTYKDTTTFRLWYQNPNKTLTNAEVGKIRKKVLERVKKKFGGILKS